LEKPWPYSVEATQRSTREIIGGEKTYHLGPSTISMRGNPYGADVYENPDNNLFANLSAAEQGIDAMPSQ